MRRRLLMDSGTYMRWETWGLVSAKKAHGRVSPIKNAGDQVKRRRSGVFCAASAAKARGEPKKWYKVNKSAATEVTIMVTAWKASVQATERMPAQRAENPERPAMINTPAMKGIAPPVMPSTRKPMPMSCTEA